MLGGREATHQWKCTEGPYISEHKNKQTKNSIKLFNVWQRRGLCTEGPTCKVLHIKFQIGRH